MNELWACFQGKDGKVSIPVSRIEWFAQRDSNDVAIKTVDDRQPWVAIGGLDLLDGDSAIDYLT